MKNTVWAVFSLLLIVSPSVRSEDACPSDFASVAPKPSEMAKLCPGEKAFAEPAVVEKTGNPLFCSYAFGHKPNMPSLPQARLRVGSNQGVKIEDAMKHMDPKAVAESDAKAIAAATESKATATKMPWKNVAAYRVDKDIEGMKLPGKSYYVKSSKGAVTLLLEAGNKTPACVEKVAEYISKH